MKVIVLGMAFKIEDLLNYDLTLNGRDSVMTIRLKELDRIREIESDYYTADEVLKAATELLDIWNKN